MGPASYRSMDETALLGVGGFPPLGTVVVIELIRCVCVREGVLLEEAVRTCLGKEGELALIDEEAFNPIDPYDVRRQRSLAYSQSQREAANLKRESGQIEGRGRKSKKRKVIKSEDEAERVSLVRVKELAGEEGMVTKKGKKRSSRKKTKKHKEKD